MHAPHITQAVSNLFHLHLMPGSTRTEALRIADVTGRPVLVGTNPAVRRSGVSQQWVGGMDRGFIQRVGRVEMGSHGRCERGYWQQVLFFFLISRRPPKSPLSPTPPLSR